MKNMQEISLTQGRVTFVDDEDFERLNEFKWHTHRNGNTTYAARGRPLIYMHRYLLNTPDNFETDHIDGDGLNNQKLNLRIVTTQENQLNQHIKKSSRFPGVCWHKRDKKWRARLTINGKRLQLGAFNTEKEAGIVIRTTLDSMNQ